jgi:hypothetical protein
MANAVAAVSNLKNLIGSKPANLRQFKDFIGDLEYEYRDFLHYTEIH